MASFRQATGSPPRRRSSESVPAIVDEDVEQVNGKLRQCEDEQAELARRYSQHFAPSKRHSLAAAKLRNDIRHMETVATTEARRSAALMEALQKRDEELRTVLAREEIQIKKLRTLIDRSGGQKCALEARVKALQAELYEEKRAASNFREQILLDMRLEQAKLLADIQGGRGDKRRPFTIDNMPPVLCSNCFETVQQKSKAGESDNAAPHKARSDVLTVISCCERREKEELSARLTLIESRASELKIGSGGPGTFVGETAKVRKARTLAASFQRRIRALRAEIPEILNSLVALFAPVFEQLSRVRASLASPRTASTPTQTTPPPTPAGPITDCLSSYSIISTTPRSTCPAFPHIPSSSVLQSRPARHFEAHTTTQPVGDCSQKATPLSEEQTAIRVSEPAQRGAEGVQHAKPVDAVSRAPIGLQEREHVTSNDSENDCVSSVSDSSDDLTVSQAHGENMAIQSLQDGSPKDVRSVKWELSGGENEMRIPNVAARRYVSKGVGFDGVGGMGVDVGTQTDKDSFARRQTRKGRGACDGNGGERRGFGRTPEAGAPWTESAPSRSSAGGSLGDGVPGGSDFCQRLPFVTTEQCPVTVVGIQARTTSHPASSHASRVLNASGGVLNCGASVVVENSTRDEPCDPVLPPSHFDFKTGVHRGLNESSNVLPSTCTLSPFGMAMTDRKVSRAATSDVALPSIPHPPTKPRKSMRASRFNIDL